MPEELEERIVEIRKQRPYLGAQRIKEEYGISASVMAIHRVLREHGLVRPRKRKYRVKRDLREVKKKLKAFERVQVDVKELQDIPVYYPYIVQGFPRYQFSARDVRTGTTFISYAYEKSATNAGIFLLYLAGHLQRMGVDLTQVTWQTDNGSEFIGSWNRKKGQTLFEEVAQWFGSKTITIPPRQSTFNSDVEAMHRLIEDEFYDLEAYRNRRHFLHKAFLYMLYFNCIRRFRYKNGQTSLQILKKTCRQPNVHRIPYLQPIILDDQIKKIYQWQSIKQHTKQKHNTCEPTTSENNSNKSPPSKAVYHVPISDSF